jgi:hypothetical protein
MNKMLNKSGFVIFSDSKDYELSLLHEYIELDNKSFDNIIFVYSNKNELAKSYSKFFENYPKNVLIIPFEEYNRIEYASAVEALDFSRTVMIIKDLRFMLKRLDQRLSMLQIKHQCYKKIIIDNLPFMTDPWKFYFPYSFFDKTILGYSHSYAFESALKNFEDGKIEADPFVPAEMARKTTPVTFINYKKYFKFEISVKTYNVTKEELSLYEKLKEHLFETEDSIKSVINKLHKFSAKLMPGHNLPAKLSDVYKFNNDSAELVINKTNLKVDDYLFSEMTKLITLTNDLTENLYKLGNKDDK